MRRILVAGEKFNRLTVIESAAPKDGRPHWRCRCECGSVKDIYHYNLILGRSKSCGCLIKEAVSESNRTHGLCHTQEYKVWNSMKNRCANPSVTGYKNYGGRGITVCDRWLKFENFLEDMGKKPEGYQIDRIDNDGDYTPDNCRWVSRLENMRNTTRSKRWHVHGVEYESGVLAAKVHGVSKQTIFNWCDGLLVNGKRNSPKDGCYSVLKYNA